MIVEDKRDGTYKIHPDAICENCLWWLKSGVWEGDCHISSPNANGWPSTKNIYWCGKFACIKPLDYEIYKRPPFK